MVGPPTLFPFSFTRPTPQQNVANIRHAEIVLPHLIEGMAAENNGVIARHDCPNQLLGFVRSEWAGNVLHDGKLPLDGKLSSGRHEPRTFAPLRGQKFMNRKGGRPVLPRLERLAP